MIQNGRRAWRKWAKRRRRRMNAHHRALYTGAKMRKAQPVQLAMPIPKLLTARSLVGRTQGERKRAFIAELDECASRVVESGGGAKEVGAWVQERFPFWRNGQKMRPCLGCPECDHGKRWRCDRCGTTKGLADLILSEVRCACGKGKGLWRIAYPARTVCDGSGVLPARKRSL